MVCTAWSFFTEVFLVNIPPLLFIVAGFVNFKYVRSIGFNRVVQFSNWFKAKIYLTYMMVFINILVAILGLVRFDIWEDDNGSNADNSRVCQAMEQGDGIQYVYVVLKMVNAVVWFASLKLLIYQYRKGLSEVWYSHKMFWILEIATNGYALWYGVYSKSYQTAHILVKAAEILI